MRPPTSGKLGSHFSKDWNAFQKRINLQVCLKTEYYFIIDFSCVRKIDQLCDNSAVYNRVQLTQISQRVPPAAKKAKLKAVCSFFYDSDELVDLRGIVEVTLKE